ncbi:MAG: NAD(P)H-dependent oxidoreductase, partial [Patescibacteria group bacterium]|nr:NAD(P)H-dependent oxidoreductase [Patescibacteria group bacterium]
MLTIKIILGSTRPNRFSEKVASWIKEALPKNDNVTLKFLDLRDYPMPFYDQPLTPSQVKDGNYGNETVKKWAQEIREADGFIFIVPEYNHGPTGVLKNALDSVFAEWNKKPAAYVGYGGVGGARAIEQLKEIAVELEMASVRSAVHIIAPWMLLNDKGELKPGALDAYAQPLQTLFSQ